MKFVRLFCLVTFLNLSSFAIHKYYMSVTHIRYVPKQKAIQITMRLFIDDLQFELNNKSKNSIELATDREPEDIDSTYKAYLSDHFLITVNEQLKRLIYIGKEYDDDMIIIYLEVLNIPPVIQIRVENTLLLRSFPEQENIVKLDINQQQKSHILTKKRSNALINY